jgi:hypothetical protein
MIELSGAEIDGLIREGLLPAEMQATRRSGDPSPNRPGAPPVRRQRRPYGPGNPCAELFAVKLWDTETAGEQTCPLLGPRTPSIFLVWPLIQSGQRLSSGRSAPS